MSFTGVVLASVLSALAGQAVVDSPQSAPGATFEYSEEPTAVVLFLQLIGHGTDTSTSFTLYGDGRLERESRVARQKRSSAVYLGANDVRALLRLAIDQGLAEWDDARIDAAMAREREGVDLIVSDAETASLTIALTRLRRGDRLDKDVHRRIRVTAPEVAAETYPSIREFRGLVQVKILINHLYEGAGGGRR